MWNLDKRQGKKDPQKIEREDGKGFVAWGALDMKRSDKKSKIEKGEAETASTCNCWWCDPSSYERGYDICCR
jgi:hypothetical protein